ncbi:head-tail joining protein [Roseomonas sp. F4]
MALDFGKLTMAPVMAIFGEVVLYERPGEPTFGVPAVLDRVALEIPFPDGPPQSSNRVQLGVQLSDFPPGFTPAQGDRVQVALLGDHQVPADKPLPPGARIHTFDVMDMQRDGAGGTLLPLTAFVPDDSA